MQCKHHVATARLTVCATCWQLRLQQADTCASTNHTSWPYWPGPAPCTLQPYRKRRCHPLVLLGYDFVLPVLVVALGCFFSVTTLVLLFQVGRFLCFVFLCLFFHALNRSPPLLSDHPGPAAPGKMLPLCLFNTMR